MIDFSFKLAASLTGMSQKDVRLIVDALPDDAGVEQLVAAFVTAVRAPQIPDSKFQTSPRDPNEPDMPRGVHSISALSEMFILDRATVVKRLRKEHVAAAFEKRKFKGFKLTDKGKSGQTVRQILEASEDPQLTDAKIRSQVASARVKELEYEERSGLIRKEIYTEARDEATRLMKSLYTRLVRRYWRENAKRLRRCKSDADLQRTGETDQGLIFDELKRDYPQMFEQT